MAEFGFIGPAYTSWSTNADAEVCINLFPERIESSPVPKYVLYGTPGLATFGTIADTPIRGLWANDTRLFAAAGTSTWEVLSNGTSSSLGGVAIADDATHTPVQIIPNGNQILIIASNKAYYNNGLGNVQAGFRNLTGSVTVTATGIGGSYIDWVSGDTFFPSLLGESIVLGGGHGTYAFTAYFSATRMGIASVPAGAPFTTTFTISPHVAAKTGAFLDGYYIVAAPDTRQINISALNDGSSWNPIDFALKEGYPDNISSILADHEELWLFGTDTTEIWQNTGAASFPLERIPGAFIHHGCVATWSPCRLKEGVAWLSSDPARGGIVAFRAEGFQPQRISTHAVEAIWRAYSSVADAVSYVYVDQGHEFWVISFPTANETWVYDATEGFWHQRAYSVSPYNRQRGAYHAYAFGKHLVGDWQTGAIYTMSMSTYTDAGASIYRVRAAPEPATGDQDWSFHGRFRLYAENSGGAGGLSPSLDWSTDGGANYNTPRTSGSVVSGTLAVWDYRRLGRSRARVWRITISAALKVALMNAFVRKS